MSPSNQPLTRRGFLKSSALAAAAIGFPTIIPSRVLGAGAPSKAVNIGLIGTGGICGVGLPHYLKLQNCRITAVCDANARKMSAKRKGIERNYAEMYGQGGYTAVREYHDFRELLAQPDIDGVYIATPDHWHVLMSLMAIEAGKDMHTEKPLANSLAEVLAFEKRIAKAPERVFTLGSEGRAKEATRIGVQVLRDGLIGEITDVVMASPEGEVGGDPGPQPVPKNLDYDLWLGPAPEKPYSVDRVENRLGIFNIRDYSLGPFSNWGIHAWDKFHMWATPAGFGLPVELEGTATFANEVDPEGLYDCPVKWRVTGRFANGANFYFVNQADSVWATQQVTGSDKKIIGHHGVLVQGTEGWVLLRYDNVVASDRSILIKAKQSANPLPKIDNHYADWIDCIQSRETPISDWESAVEADITYHLADIAIRSGKKVTWDHQNRKVGGGPEVEALISRPMRAPFTL